MGTTKSRKSRRNNSRPTAFTFLSNIALGSENEKPPDDSIRINSSYLSTTDPDVLHYAEEATANEQVGGIASVANNQPWFFLNSCWIASSLHSSDSSFSADEDNVQTAIPSDSHGRPYSATTPPVITTNGNQNDTNPPKRGKYLSQKRHPSESSNEDVQHHKLTREDSERPIASEKIKKKSNHNDKDVMYHWLCVAFEYLFIA